MPYKNPPVRLISTTARLKYNEAARLGEYPGKIWRMMSKHTPDIGFQTSDMLSTEDVLSSWGFWYQSLGSHIKSEWKVFCQMSHLMARLCVRFMSNWHWGYVSQLSNATFDSCKLLPSFIPDWHTLCVRSDWQSLTFVYLRSICKYQHSSFARNIDLLEMLTYSSLANPGSLMTVSLSCHQHGHATIAPTQSRPWHQRHLSTGNCRHQSAEAWSLYVLSACLDLRWFK